jgi:hypothetical protein
VEDFALRLNGMVATLATLGEVVEEYVVVEKILRCMPPCLKQIALAITTLLDGQSLTVAGLLGRLKAAKEAFEEPSSTLQQDGYQVLIGSGKLAIREPSGKLLAKVKQTASRLSLLTVTLSITMTRCMAA